MSEVPGEDFGFPTPHHRAALDEVLAGLRADADVLGVLLCGSLARGTAREDSDIDLLVVLAGGEGVTVGEAARCSSRTRHGAIDVEQSCRTVAGWTAQFAPSRIGDESWGYAFLDGAVLHDLHGAVARLVDAAATAHARYRVPEHITAHYAWLWRHLRPKMEAVLRSADATEVGWATAVMTKHLTNTLWAINGRPLPSRDLGTFQRHLGDLTVPHNAPALIRELLAASPKDGLRLQLRLLDLVMPYLLNPRTREVSGSPEP